MSDSPTLQLPPHIARLTAPVGAHRRGFKFVVWGHSGGGKSPFLASMPGPRFGIDMAGIGGLQQYLDPATDQCFIANNATEFLALVKYGLSQHDHFSSLLIDPMTTSWEEFMDYWSEKNGGEIKGAQWNAVKTEWKLLLRSLMHSKMNVGMSAWLKDQLWEQTEEMPGVKKLQIRPVELPQLEKKTEYYVDAMFQVYVVRDKKNRPTSKHEIRLSKGRRPKSVPPDAWHVGKTWTFDEKTPENLWDKVVAPIAAAWDNGAVDYLGIDPREAAAELRDAEGTYADHEVGRLTRLINEQTDLTTYKGTIWPQVEAALNNLDAPRQAIVRAAHEDLKRRLG